MIKTGFRLLPILLCFAIILTVGSVFATWQYPSSGPVPANKEFGMSLGDFQVGTFYIAQTDISGGSYAKANISTVGDLDLSSDITLHSNNGSSVTVKVTFYNNSSISYYYNKTETVSVSQDRISYTVTGIEQKEEVRSKTLKTVYVTFAYTENNFTNTSLLSQLHFNFVIDKSSIGEVVAQTAVDRFRDILNNKVFDNSYQTLEDAMNNRSGYNKASAVTYIGNVYGSSSSDSAVIETLFGQEFMSMDLDGDGDVEPITMMIKREDLDGNDETGDSYTYTDWRGRETIVNGAEMTLYITSENLQGVSSGKTTVVYAAAFTKLPGATQWTDLVSLTKGTAKANNYSGYGSANSFNTDTWVSDGGKTVKQLAQNS